MTLAACGPYSELGFSSHMHVLRVLRVLRVHASIRLLFVYARVHLHVRVCAWHVTNLYQALAIIVCSVWSAFGI